MQYPAQKSTVFSTVVLRFVDGTEQRFAGYVGPLRQWLIRLELLDQGEVNDLASFVLLNNGAGGTFAFTDPWDGTVYSNCSFRSDSMAVTFTGESQIATNLTVTQNAK